MTESFYKVFHVVGQGTVPLQCANFLTINGFSCTFWETINDKNSIAYSRSKILGINYKRFDEFQFMNCVTNNLNKTLIISANNPIIIPKNIVDATHVKIINYHNSILPLHRGVNAEAWSIYDMDEYTGISWHRVDNGIDTGNILVQRFIKLNSNYTSFSLLRDQASMAIESFKYIINDVLVDIECENKQPNTGGSIHLRSDIPNGGELSCNWPSSKIWSFLRAMDYGCLYNLGSPYLKYSCYTYRWRSYYLINDLCCDPEFNTIVFLDNNIILNGCIVLSNVFTV